MSTQNKKYIINKCDQENDLGVIFDKYLRFDYHINKCISTANKMLGIIKRTFISKEKTVLLTLYKSIVRSHLEYANVIWNNFLKKTVTINRKSTETCH